MGRKKAQDPIATQGDRIAYSWLPAGMEPDDVLAGAGWKPEPGDVRTFTITGFQKREGENGEYLIVNGVDYLTGEMFAFAPGGLFSYLVENAKIETGHTVSMRYKGKKVLPGTSGFQANDWDIVKVKAAKA
jgi:hypothetical protein